MTRIHAAPLALLLALAACATAPDPVPSATQAPAQAEVRAVVQRLFDGMRAADSGMVRAAFAPGARFALVDARATPATIRYDTPDGWLGAIARSGGAWDERLHDVEVRVDGNIAQVWTPYVFYVNGTRRHCGVNTMELLRDGSGWRITQLSDTQRREGCREVPKG